MQPKVEVRAKARESDLALRLAAAPASAEVRGVFLHVIEHALREEGIVDTRPLLAAGSRVRAYTMVPLRDYLVQLETAALLVANNVEVGLARLHARAASFLLGHPGARLFLGARDRDPVVLLERLERSRSLIASYGRVQVRARPGDVVVEARDEYVWLDAVWASIVRSVFTFASIDGAVVDCTMQGPFDGVIRARW